MSVRVSRARTAAVAMASLLVLGGAAPALAARDDDHVDLVRPDGTHTTVLTAADGLRTPTSIAVHGSTVYVPSAAYLTNKDPNLLLAHLDR